MDQSAAEIRGCRIGTVFEGLKKNVVYKIPLTAKKGKKRQLAASREKTRLARVEARGKPCGGGGALTPSTSSTNSRGGAPRA